MIEYNSAELRLDHLRGTVGRPIINDQDFDIALLGDGRLNCFSQIIFSVFRRDDYSRVGRSVWWVGFVFQRRPISLAGTPATIELPGTSFVTTLPAPIIAPAPIVVPFRMLT